MYEPSQQDRERVNRNFTYHKPLESKTNKQSDRYEHIRDKARRLALDLLELCPSSRELALALTNLEQSVMWANAAIARNEKLSDLDPIQPADDADKMEAREEQVVTASDVGSADAVVADVTATD